MLTQFHSLIKGMTLRSQIGKPGDVMGAMLKRASNGGGLSCTYASETGAEMS